MLCAGEIARGGVGDPRPDAVHGPHTRRPHAPSAQNAGEEAPARPLQGVSPVILEDKTTMCCCAHLDRAPGNGGALQGTKGKGS